jgi:hypothetical protein
MPPVPAPPATAPLPPAAEVLPAVDAAPLETAAEVLPDVDALDLEPLPDLRLPAVPSPRLELPPLEAVSCGAPAERPRSVAGFVAAELRSIPSQWIEEATGRRRATEPVHGRALVAEGGAAVAVAAAPELRLAVRARVQLVPAPPVPEVAEPIPYEPASGWPLAPAAIIRPCPLPDGARLFGPLSSGYVDGPSLLRELGGRGHSGALVTAGGGRAQAVILHRGAVLALVAAGRSGTRRLESLRLPVAGQEQEHDLTVPVYRPEVAVALGQLVNLAARFRRMHASFVRLPALLEHLAETRMTGGVRVITSADVGVLLLCSGEVLGAYTARHPALEEPELVARLCAAGEAEIDVHASPLEGTPPEMAVERLLG